MNVIEIWAPRFHDRKVLIKPFNIKEGMNKIVFTKTQMPDLLIHSDTIYECPMEQHGSRGVYAVPLNLFHKATSDQLELVVMDKENDRAMRLAV